MINIMLYKFWQFLNCIICWFPFLFLALTFVNCFIIILLQVSKWVDSFYIGFYIQIALIGVVDDTCNVHLSNQIIKRKYYTK